MQEWWKFYYPVCYTSPVHNLNTVPKIVIYTTPWCSYCKMAKEYFKSKGLTWEEYDVMSDIPKREEMVKKSGQLGVPVIEIDGKMVIGFDRPKINEYLGVH